MADLEVFKVLSVGAIADESSANDAVNKLMKGVSDALGKDGRIDLNTELNIDIKKAKKDVLEAQDAVVTQWEKMFSKKGFSASADDLDKLTQKYSDFKVVTKSSHLNNERTVRTITNTIGKVVELYNAYKKLIKIQQEASEITDISLHKKPKKTKPKPKRPRDFGSHSDEEIESDIKKDTERKYKGIDKVTPKKPRGGAIDPGKTNSRLVHLSEYSAHGSRWAEELSRSLKIGLQEAKDTLKKWIDRDYVIGTRTGKEKNPIGLGNKNSQVTERTVLNATLNKVSKALTDSIKAAESGDETITLDVLKEQAAIMTVLGNHLGKTADQIKTRIVNAIEEVYSYKSETPTKVKGKDADKSTLTKLGGTNLENGKDKGVGPNHKNTQIMVEQLYQSMKDWRELEAERMTKEVSEKIDKSLSETEDKISTAAKLISEIQMSDEFKTEIANLNSVVSRILSSATRSWSLTEKQLLYDKIDHAREHASDDRENKTTKLNSDINRDIAKATKQDLKTDGNIETNTDKLVILCQSIKGILSELNPNAPKTPKVMELPEGSKGLYKGISGASIGQLALPKVDRRRKYMATEPKSLIPSESKLPALIPGEFAKTLKEAINPSVLDFERNSKETLGSLLYTYSGRTLSDMEKAQNIKDTEERTRKFADIVNARKAREKAEIEARETFDKTNTIRMGEEPRSHMVQKSTIRSTPMNDSIWSKWESAIMRITGATEDYRKVIEATAEDQDEMAAQRIIDFGLNNGKNPNDTGDKASIKRSLELFRTNKRSIEENPDLMQNIRLTEGVDINTTEVMKKYNKMMSGHQMRNAQMGGSPLRQVLGAFTGFVGMPSLEKSRAQADGLNQMLGNINKAFNSVLDNIQMKETELKGLEDAGKIEFDKEGQVIRGSSEAKKTLADSEEEKLVLKTILADMGMMDQLIKKTGGTYSKMLKVMSFTSPVLRENNDIIRNINSGLDKNGKALKFQKRTAEILNYTFQLMSRHVGQILKQFLLMANPLNIIKKAFTDFAGYDVKWQRTLNVIKYNLRDIIKPMMEWIAQKLVNMIGFVDIISQKIQAAFGRNPISLFDQENANQVKKDAEEIASISAGFDELHDIGTEGSDKDANNLLGEIYKPELSPEWQKLAEDIGDLFAGVIKGDLGFSEAMTEILRILGETLKLIGGIIWDFIKETIWPFIKDNWLEILGWILAAFMAWKGLSLLGTLLWKALFGLFTKSKIASVFSNVGQWILSSLGLNSLAQGISLGFSSLLAGGKYSLIGTIGEMFTNSAAITASQSWGSMIGFAFVKALAATVSIALGGKMLADAFDGAADNASYDAGLMASGGNEEDKKGIGVGNVLKGTAGGAAIGFGIGQIIPVVGPVVGAAIGAVVGALTTSLAPAFEKVEIAARNANNEMQKMEYYEGVVQGYSTEVQKLTELQQVLNDTLDLQKTKVYEEGEQLGITRTRMDELVTSITNGTFSIDMLNGSEIALKDSLIQLNDQQIRTTEATEKLEAAKRKLQKAEIDLAIAEDVAAGNFELAAARIEYAEAAMLYTEEEATAKRVQLYKEAGEEEAKYLLQDLTPEQRKKMAEINGLTQEELASLVEKWRGSSEDVKEAFLSGVDQDTQNKFEQQMNEIDGIIEEHQGFWQGVGDTLKEIFTFGIADTWTYNGETKASAEYKSKVAKMAVGTNYVPHDGLAYLHQGEAIIPKKYNQPYQPASMSPEERAYMTQMMSTMRSLDSTMKQGINVNGQFVQRGSDLVAVVNKTKSQTGADLLSNVSYAR